MGVTDIEFEIRPLEIDLVSNTHQFELFDKSLGNALDGIVDQGTAQPVVAFGDLFVIVTSDRNKSFAQLDMDLFVKINRQGAFWSLYLYQLFLDVQRDILGNIYRLSTNS